MSKIKIIEKIKNLIYKRNKSNKKNNSKQNHLKYIRNKYGFFSLENKEK